MRGRLSSRDECGASLDAWNALERRPEIYRNFEPIFPVNSHLNIQIYNKNVRTKFEVKRSTLIAALNFGTF